MRWEIFTRMSLNFKHRGTGSQEAQLQVPFMRWEILIRSSPNFKVMVESVEVMWIYVFLV